MYCNFLIYFFAVTVAVIVFRECHTNVLEHVNEIDQFMKFIICCKITMY